jgi:Fe-S cluster assembly protein SufD
MKGMENKITSLFEREYRIFAASDSVAGVIRLAAFERFLKAGFPTLNLESWKNTDLSSVLKDDYHILSPDSHQHSETQQFHCDIKGLSGYEIPVVNGLCNNRTLTVLPNGVIFGSLSAAMKEKPELVKPHFGQYSKNLDGFSALNDMLWLDGAFLYIPDNVVLDRPVQMMNVYNSHQNLFVSVRNLVLVGKNSKATLLQCDDSTNHQRIFSNTITEINVAQNAEIEYYKLQNINNETAIINRMMFHQEANSRLNINQISLNGGLLRNDIHTQLSGEHAEAEISGAYLMDKNQFIDNHIFIHHAVPYCTSKQEFRGVLDDYAGTVFNGHILVDKNAQKTQAIQNCRNILISDKAKIETQPFLEIYADDVKCSHGASVGQLDNEALFYLRSRGIGEDHARTLLMYAFVAGILDKIKIAPLKARYADMIKGRLSGNLGICEQCVLDCSKRR